MAAVVTTGSVWLPTPAVVDRPREGTMSGAMTTGTYAAATLLFRVRSSFPSTCACPRQHTPRPVLGTTKEPAIPHTSRTPPAASSASNLKAAPAASPASHLQTPPAARVAKARKARAASHQAQPVSPNHQLRRQSLTHIHAHTHVHTHCPRALVIRRSSPLQH